VRLLDDVNNSPVEVATRRLEACNASRRWIAAMLDARPFTGVESLLTTAEQVARTLDWDDVCEALDAHPRIGDRAAGDSREAGWSRDEQSSVGGADDATRAALADGNAAYEQRFGHVFLIRAAGRAPEEMLAELRRRLANDPAAEQAEVTGQLAEITRLRLRKLVAG
jgi:2-oxo-4-hydroxy-4-carboxy-5-ureidoimidazoline decarboxylase